MKGNVHIVKIVNHIFFICVNLELAMGIWHHAGHTLPGTRYLLWIFFLVYFMEMCIHKYERKEILLFLFAEVIGLLLYKSAGINSGIKLPVFVLACKEINYKKMLQTMLITLCGMFVLVICLNLFFSVGRSYLTDVRPERGMNGIRYQFGFTNTNVCQFMAVMILMLYYYVFHEKIGLLARTIPFLLFLILRYYTDSLTGFIMGAFVFIAFLELRYLPWKNWSDAIFVIHIFMFVSFLVISVGAACHFNNPVWNLINRIISGRMTQLGTTNNEAFHLLGYVENWKLFSSNLNKNFYDLGYIQVFYYYGVIPGIAYIVYLAAGIYASWKSRKTGLQLLLLTCTIYVFMEALFFTNYLTFDLLSVVTAICVMGT